MGGATMIKIKPITLNKPIIIDYELRTCCDDLRRVIISRLSRSHGGSGPALDLYEQMFTFTNMNFNTQEIEDIKMNFCPFCGEKLEVILEEQKIIERKNKK